MIKFKQKVFWGAALNGVMAGGTVIGIGQARSQQKEIERANEEQAELIKEQNKKLDKIVEKAKSNPGAAAQAAEQMKSYNQQRGFSAVPTKVWNTVRGMGKEAWKNDGVKKHLIGGTVSGVALGAGSVLAGKAISVDAKRNGIDFQQKSYAASSVMQGVRSAGKTIYEHGIKGNKGMIGTMAAMGSIPLATQYLAERKQLKDQTRATQKSYAMVNPVKIARNTGKWVSTAFRKPGELAWLGNQEGTKSTLKNGWNSFKKHPGNSTLSWVNKNLAFAGGNKGTQKYAKQIAENSGKYGDNYMKEVGGFMQKHKKTALVAGIPVGLGAMSYTWDAGEKVTKGIAKKIDPSSVAYQESKEQGIS